MDLEGLQGMLIIGRAENQRRRIIHLAEMLGGFHTIHFRHANIHQDHIRPGGLGLLNGFPAVSRFCHHFNPVGLFHQPLEPVPRQLFVVAHKHPHNSHPFLLQRISNFDLVFFLLRP